MTTAPATARMDQLEKVLKQIANCLPVAGMAFSEVTKGKPSQKQVDWIVTQTRNSLVKIDIDLASHIKHLIEKTKTGHDGSDTGGCDAMFQQCMGKDQRPPSIDVKSVICPSQLLDARRFIDGLHLNISKRMKSEEGRVQTLTANLSRSIQVRKIVSYVSFNLDSFLFR